jgi:hypothetical protein
MCLAGARNHGLDNNHLHQPGSRKRNDILLRYRQSGNVGSKRICDHWREDILGEAEGALTSASIDWVHNTEPSLLEMDFLVGREGGLK